MTALAKTSDWQKLFRIGTSLIDQANSRHNNAIEHWTFGGGTAMMLQIDHRESHDVDLFLDDPQFLALLNPDTSDFSYDLTPTGYEGDGTQFRKFAFENVGEIDFIIGSAKTSAPTIQRQIEGRLTLLETVPEIIAKKIVYRGASIKPRDIFDIAAAAQTQKEAVVSALRAYKPQVESALQALGRLNPDFVKATIGQLQIREKFRPLTLTALRTTQTILASV